MKCKAIKGNGVMCARVATTVDGFCHLHDPARLAERKRNASIAGRSRTNFLDKVRVLTIKDSSDIAEALRLYIEQMLKRNKIQDLVKMQLFAAFVRLYVSIEKDSLVPKRMKDIEKLLEKAKQSNLDGSSQPK